ncbi:MAG: right-handed parallel beta-helix repeat-containing protein [Candidatus Tenebribacter burtonii]|nr:right-handed parallel beta-helix repeat-containing protein [Candidatus Tenebribacter burtonii]
MDIEDEDLFWLWDAFETIQEGIVGVAESTPAGDILTYVYVAAGTYTENVNVNKSLTLIGASSAVVTVNAVDAKLSVFNVTASNVTISGFTASGATGGDGNFLDGKAGIYLNSVVSCYIHDNILTGNFDGLFLYESDNNTITDNNCSSNQQGVGVYLSDTNTFTGNTSNLNAGDYTVGFGFKIQSSDSNTFDNNTTNSNYYGYFLVEGTGTGCTNTMLTGNTVNSNTQYGIRMSDGIATTLTGNTFDSNSETGILVKGEQTSLVITNNTIINNGGSGTRQAGVWNHSAIDVSTWTVHDNKIVGNTLGISNAALAGALDATNNWWGDEKGPLNATYNPQGIDANGVSDNVNFSHWWTTEGSDFGAIEGSSEIAIQHAIDNTGFMIENDVYNTNGTISLDVKTTYPTAYLSYLPEELLNDALIVSDAAFNAEADIVFEGFGYTIPYDIGGLDELWLSDILGSANPLFNQPAGPNPEIITITFNDLDDGVYNLTMSNIAARSGNFDSANIYNETAVCDYNNDYRGITDGDGYLLGYDTITLQDPMQVALGGTFDIVDLTLACNVADEITFSTQQVFATFPETPVLSNDWLTDAWIQTDIAVPVGTEITIEGWGQTWTRIMAGELGFWLSEETLVQYPLAGHSGLTVDYDITVTGLNSGQYTLEMWSVTAATGNFNELTLLAEISQNQYQLGYDTIDIIDPIQYAINGSTLDIVDATLASNTDGTITFDISMDYSVQTHTPDLPVQLLVDAFIESDPPLNSQATMDVQTPWGGGALFENIPVGNLTDEWLSVLLNSVSIYGVIPRNPLIGETDYSVTVTVKNLDAQARTITISSIASGFDMGGQEFTDPQFTLGTDTITIQDPIQYAIENTNQYISDPICYPNDVVEFEVTVNYDAVPVDYTLNPPLPNDLLMDARITFDPPLVNATILELYYEDGSLGFTTIAAETAELYLSEVIYAINSNLPTRTPLIDHTGLVLDWKIKLQGLDSSQYDIYFETIASDFGAGEDVSWIEFVLAVNNKAYQIIDPIQYTIDNTTLYVATVDPLTDAGIFLDIETDYADITDIPYIPIAPLEVLYLDALIELGGEQRETFPAGTVVTIRKYIGGNLVYTWEEKTLPEGESFAWLSEIMSGLFGGEDEDRVFPLSAADNTVERFEIEIDNMNYSNYDFTVSSIAATNGNFEPYSTGGNVYDDLVFDTTERFVIGSDTVLGVQIPYFTTLEIEVSEDLTSWYEPDSQSYDDADLILDAAIELDVDVGTFYVNLNSYTETNTELALGYHGFYIDTENYPGPHSLIGGPTDDPGCFDYTYLEYWASRGVDENASGGWEETMYDIITGELPFFYIEVTTDITDVGAQTFELIDGLHHQLGMEEYMQLEGDHYLGDYVFTGYVYSKSHDVESNGVAELRSDLITVNITLQDLVETTYPDFTTLNLQDQVQGSDNWIDLEMGENFDINQYTMYLNEAVEYYELDIKDETTVTNYDFAPQYQPLFLIDVEYGDPFFAYWNAKGVNNGAAGGWEEIMWYIINGELPMFYIDVANDQTMTLIDGLLFALNHLMPSDVDAAFRINGTYPLGGYLVEGDLVGINGTMYDNYEIVMYMEEAYAIQYDLTIYEPEVDVITPIYEMVENVAYDMLVEALDMNDILVAYHPNSLILFEADPSAYTSLAPLRVISNGTLTLEDGIVSNHVIPELMITINDDFSDDVPPITTEHPGYSVIAADVVIEDPLCFDVDDYVVDQGGFVYATICLSPNDPFYVQLNQEDPEPAEPYIDHYTIERFSEPEQNVYDVGVWEWFESIDCYDTGGQPIVTSPLATIASDDFYEYRVTAVYVPNNDQTEKAVKTKKEVSPTDEGAQSEWVYSGGAAAMDNIPAYADFTVFLEGPYTTGGLMVDGMTKPLTSPYNGETITALPLQNDDIIDWVYIELRETETGETVKECNAFLLPDGSVVDVNGYSSLPFFYTTSKEYYIVINHRNHLAIMSAGPNVFSDSPMADDIGVINLSVAGSVYLDGVKEMETGVYAMYSGDADNNGEVQNNDKNDYWAVQIGQSGYLSADFDLNGEVQNNDKNDYWQYNIGYGSAVPVQAGDNITKTEHSIEIVGNSGNRDIVGITFTFDNYGIIGDYYEFDVMVAASDAGTRLGDNQIYINYSTAGFGSSIWTNSKVTVTKGTLTAGDDLYGSPLFDPPIVVDNTASRISIQNSFISAAQAAMYLPTTPTQLVHVQIEIENALASSGLSFQGDLMTNQQYQSDNSTHYDPVIAIDTVDLPLPVILSSFTTAYIEDTPVIYWTTETETGNEGWNVYRSDSQNLGQAMLLNEDELIGGAGNSTVPTDYTFVDMHGVEEDFTYYYWIESVSYSGETEFYGPVSLTIPLSGSNHGTPGTLDIYGLYKNYPNPFNPSTLISFALEEDSNVELIIYNVKGEKIKSIFNDHIYANQVNSVVWYGKDASGKQVSSGVYLYKLITDTKEYSNKMLLVK